MPEFINDLKQNKNLISFTKNGIDAATYFEHKDAKKEEIKDVILSLQY